MPNQGHARAVQAQAFGKSSGGGLLFRLAAIGLVLTGLALAIVAVVTAAAPVATDQIRVVLDAFDRLGLDKGPAAFFGVAFFGLGLAILRGGSGGGSRDAADAAAYASQTAGDVEGLTAIVAQLQSELGSLRHEVGEARREIHESTQSADASADGGNTASDPIFRLAASLDQLGARVDKRIDGTRKEMLEAGEAMAETIRSVTKEQTEAAREQRAEFEGLRMDMADLHAEVIGELAQRGENVVVDQFERRGLVRARREPLGVRLTEVPRAERHAAVAAASILARREFLLGLKELSEDFGVDLRKGAGAPTDWGAA